MIPWGRAADRFGRKPVLVVSMWGLACSMSLFGFSRTPWQMVFFRCVAGFFGGTIVTLRTMISEVCTKKTEARAFSYFSFAGNVGIFLGPLLGGALSKPAETWPSTFGKMQLFIDYPYALPTLVVGAIPASAAVLSMLFVKETMDWEKKGEESSEPMSILDILRADGVGSVLFFYLWVFLLAISYTSGKFASRLTESSF